MNRREALQRLAAAGATIGAVSAVTTSVAFADGGSTNCQPNPGQNIPHPFWSTAACTVVAGPAIRVVMQNNTTYDPGSPTTLVCPRCKSGVTPTSSVQYRLNVNSPGGYAFYAAATGGSPLTWVNAIAGQTFYMRSTTSGGAIPNQVYEVFISSRFVCTSGTAKAWRCRYMRATITVSGNSSQNAAYLLAGPHGLPGPYCDSPAP